MRIIKKIKLIWTFYKNFLFLSMLVTLICVGLSWEYGYGIFNTLFWLKTGTLVLTYFFINSYKSREYYYFQNLGISRTLLWASAMLFDFTLYLLLIIQTNRLR
jgi:hypothetical protein